MEKFLQRNVIFSGDAETASVQVQRKKACLTNRRYLTPYKEKHFSSEDSLLNIMLAFPVSINLCCQNYLNERIHRLFAAGVFQKIEEDERFFVE